MQRRWGAISDFQRLPEGLDAQVFAFRHRGADFVIRVRESAAGFDKDAYVAARFGSAVLPIPEVLEIDRLDDGHAFCISQRVSGVRLHDLEEGAMERVAPLVARTIGAIASSDVSGTTGYGPFDAHGMAPFAAWRDYLIAVADPHRYAWKAVADKVDPALISRCVAAVQDLSRFCPEARRLVHGDFGSYNALSDGHAVTGVIDWDLALFGDPLYEWANLRFWGEDRLAPMVARFGPPAAPPLLCYQLRIGLEEVYRLATGRNPGDPGWLNARCAAILREAGLPS